MRRFIAENRARLHGDDYAALYEWSIERPDEFWASVWKFCGVQSDTEYRTVLRDAKRMPGATWFDGATLNFAANLLAPNLSGAALVFANERGERGEIDWAELRRQVAAVAEHLRTLGVRKGDRVAAFIANRPEAVVAMLATASLGAVWSSCSPDFGVDAVIDRFGQIEPKVLFATDGYFYNGKSIDSMPTIRALSTRLPQLSAVVVVPYRTTDPDLSGLDNAILFGEALEHQSRASLYARRILGPALHSLFVRHDRRAEVHRARRRRHAVAASQGARASHSDVKPGDVVFYFTTCGWMMWNWLVSALASGATLVLYDGAPLYPDPDVLWRLAEQERIAVFGTSAKYLSALEKTGCRPRDRHASARAAHNPVDRLAAVARELRFRLPRTSRKTCSWRRSRAEPTSSRASRSATRCCRSIAASCNAAASA